MVVFVLQPKHQRLPSIGINDPNAGQPEEMFQSVIIVVYRQKFCLLFT